MNVLLVLATSGGGVGRHVAQIGAGLAAGGDHQVRVAGPVDTERDFAFTATGIGFEPLDVSARPRPRADLRAVRRLRTLAAGADVVHAHGLRAGALAVLAVRGLRRARRNPARRNPARRNPARGNPARPKVVVTLHNALVSAGRIALVHAVLERIVARGADVVLVVSADLGEAIGRRGARDVRLAVVPAPLLGPALRTPAAVRAEFELPAGTALLLTIARLAPQKGLDVLVDAVARLGADGVEVVAVVAGDGPLAAGLRADAAARGVPLRLLGLRGDVSDLLAAADLVVVPSRWEGQPLNVQEALLAGAAIVATDAGGTAAVVRDGAVLVPAGDPAALAGAIAGLLTDPGALAGLRERAVARGRTLPTAEDALRQVISVYGPGSRSE